MILLNPKHHTRPYPDERSREIMRKTIAFFEDKGKRRLKEDDQQAGLVRRLLSNSSGRKVCLRPC